MKHIPFAPKTAIELSQNFGTNAYGTCNITVTAKPSTVDYDIDALTSAQVTTNSTSTLVFTSSPVTVTINNGSSSTNANNYVASGTNPHTRAYTGQTLRLLGRIWLLNYKTSLYQVISLHLILLLLTMLNTLLIAIMITSANLMLKTL